MQLDNKVAVIYGGGGVIGGSVARAFAKEGAHVFLTGPTERKLAAVASSIRNDGGSCTTSVVDALDHESVEAHARDMVDTVGRIDISFNAMGRDEIDIGVPLVDLTPETFLRPITTWATSHFITATAAGRHMSAAGGGVIIILSSGVSRMYRAMAGGFLGACNLVEQLTTQLAAELGPHGVRVTCLRPAGLKESVAMGSITGDVWGRAVGRMGKTLEEYLENFDSGEFLRRTVLLDEVSNAACFLASDLSSGITATITDVSCGQVGG